MRLSHRLKNLAPLPRDYGKRSSEGTKGGLLAQFKGGKEAWFGGR